MEKHLKKKLGKPIVGNRMIEVLNYTKSEQSVDKKLISSNQIQHLEDVPSEVLNFRIDSYQICKTWLQARNGFPSNNDEVQRYQKMVMVLKDMVKLMEEIKTAIYYDQLKKLAIFEKVRAIVVEHLEIAPEKVTFTSNFVHDLGADSLDIVELVIALEEAFNIEIPKQIAETLLTVQQVINYVSQKVQFAI